MKDGKPENVHEMRANMLNREISALQEMLAFRRAELNSIQAECPHGKTRPSVFQTMSETVVMECEYCGKTL
jgi:hypothetical protein